MPIRIIFAFSFRRDGWVAESGILLRCWALIRGSEGSNPSLSAMKYRNSLLIWLTGYFFWIIFFDYFITDEKSFHCNYVCKYISQLQSFVFVCLIEMKSLQLRLQNWYYPILYWLNFNHWRNCIFLKYGFAWERFFNEN